MLSRAGSVDAEIHGSCPIWWLTRSAAPNHVECLGPDINDAQNSNSANILTEQPRYLVGDSLAGGDVSPYTAQTPQEYRSTHIVQDMMGSLDHVLVGEEFYANRRKRIWMFDGMTSTMII